MPASSRYRPIARDRRGLLLVGKAWSSRTMARTGLRMMPTFPSPPLKFRTAGFPQYGFKASMSDRAFLQTRSLKPAPGIRLLPRSLLLPFAHFHHRRSPGSVSGTVAASACRCAGGLPSLPQGSLAPARVMLSRTLCAYYSPMRQSRRHAATSRLCRLYAAPSLCGSAEATRETFPTFTAVLSMHAADPTPVVHRALPLYSHGDSRLARIISEQPTTSPVSASNNRRGSPFRGCIIRFMLRPTCLPSPPGWLQRDEVTCSSSRLLRYIVTPAFNAVRRHTTLGIRLDGRTGNLPSSGLSPDKSRQLVRLHNNPG
jgi:hypothetical protein